MPPKDMRPKKLSKKEQLELEREEKRKREEEERIRQEQEEKKRIEQERLRKELEAKLAEEEKIRIKEEEKELEKWYSTVEKSSKTYEEEMKKKEDWAKYTSCSLKPDVSQEADLTTYITTYSETNKIKSLSIEEVIQDFQYTEELINDLTPIMMKAYADADNKKVNWCKHYIQKLREISYRKIEEATAHIAKNTDLLIEEEANKDANKESKDAQSKTYKSEAPNPQKNEMITKFHNCPDVKYGIWINPSDKPSTRVRSVDFDKGIQVDIPRPLLNKKLIIRVVWTSFDNYSGEEYNKDFIVGGVIDVGCYEFLTLPKKAKNWVLKYDYDVNEAVKKIQYPSPDSTGPLSFQHASPCKIIYTLPSYVYFTPNDVPRVAAFDGTKNGWVTDNIDEIKYDHEKKLLSFTSLRLAPLALVQDRCTDYPYGSWELRCVEEQKAILDIKGKRQNMRFEIGPSYVMLKNRSEPELAHIVNKKFTPGVLLKELFRCGINLLPVQQDAENCNLPVTKSLEAELKAINEIGFGVRLFFIKSSKWNTALSPDKILVRMRENPEFDEEFAEDQEKDWKSVVFGPNKCYCIKARDSSETLDETLLNGTESHANLELLLKKHDLTNEDWLFRLHETEYIGFIDTLKRFLKLTHILTFTLG